MDLPFPPEGGAVYISHRGEIDPERRWDPSRPTAVLAGAFNPVHAGHRGLAAAAEDWLGLPLAFELSVANVDKPALTPAEVRHRLEPFAGNASLWLTHAPRFVQKAELFPGAVFVVGADTAARIVDPRYYDGDPDRMRQALDRLQGRGCRFLVACRLEAGGRCAALVDLPIPPSAGDLFIALPTERFRLDISSTEIRGRG
jgi:hypothetical protein